MFDVFVPVCKPCPVCGKMPVLSREYNGMKDGRICTILCKERHYYINTCWGSGDAELISVWNLLVETYGPHRMGRKE